MGPIVAAQHNHLGAFKELLMPVLMAMNMRGLLQSSHENLTWSSDCLMLLNFSKKVLEGRGN